eukprot:TRINITY_DN32409_c0_g1_i1.p1 TRINITY_DN32409_c0_g1~~TRINITY_DN32409_c0_g1_i1.p1  ORF type:complete len:121 (-),score=11.48 TRINITY_DN32409_c0_g1_i1:19-381(-)
MFTNGYMINHSDFSRQADNTLISPKECPVDTPDFTFTFDTFDLVIPVQKFMVHSPDTGCHFLTKVSEIETEYFIFGKMVLDSNVIIFDRDNQKIGFAERTDSQFDTIKPNSGSNAFLSSQ